METAGLGGFALLLAGWFGMFFRLRRDHPDHPDANYGGYVGPRLFGIKMGRSGLGLVLVYWRLYGLDIWSSLSLIGLALLVSAAVWPA